MEDTDDGRQQRVEAFYCKHKTALLASARRLDQQCPEDIVQAIIEVWLRPTYNPQFTFMAFVRQMELLVFRDTHYQPRRVPGEERQIYTDRPSELHGNVDRMWRRRHGRRTTVKGGAE